MKTFDLKRFRRDKKLTQNQLKDILGYENNTFISQIENRRKAFPMEKVEILQNLYGDITSYIIEVSEAEKPVTIEINATPQEIVGATSDAYARSIVKMMNDGIIAPFGLLVEKDKEIASLNRQIGRLQAELDACKKDNAQTGASAICADAG